MAKLTKQDWIDVGFEVLREFAQNKLRILYLCDRLKVTRGSFYHHFKSIESYIGALMQAWERIHTQKLIEISDLGKDGEDKMKILADLVFESDHRLEAAIRSWSFTDEIVKTHVDRVDKKRFKYLEKLFSQMGHSTNKSKNLARIDYATLVGMQLLFPNISKKELKNIYKDYWLKP